MTDRKPRFFIHDRREAAILVLLAVLVAVFAFTLGIHLGKRVSGNKGAANSTAETPPVETAPESAPEVDAKVDSGAGGNPDDAMTQALHDEVARTGIKLEKGRQVNLPEKTRSKTGGATTLQGAGAPEKPAAGRPVRKADNQVESNNASSKGAFTIQVGSHATSGEAEHQVAALGKKGIAAYIQQARVEGKGVRYRVLVGGYSTHAQAQGAGEQLRRKGLIASYLVGHPSRKQGGSAEGGD